MWLRINLVSVSIHLSRKNTGTVRWYKLLLSIDLRSIPPISHQGSLRTPVCHLQRNGCSYFLPERCDFSGINRCKKLARKVLLVLRKINQKWLFSIWAQFFLDFGQNNWSQQHFFKMVGNEAAQNCFRRTRKRGCSVFVFKTLKNTVFQVSNLKIEKNTSFETKIMLRVLNIFLLVCGQLIRSLLQILSWLVFRMIVRSPITFYPAKKNSQQYKITLQTLTNQKKHSATSNALGMSMFLNYAYKQRRYVLSHSDVRKVTDSKRIDSTQSTSNSNLSAFFSFRNKDWAFKTRKTVL